MSEFFDLFGNAVKRVPGFRGRPAFEWTEEKSSKVRLALALGWTVPRIANAIACSPATLKRHFGAELKEREMARDQLELQRVFLAAKAADAGNVGAMRQLDRLVERNDNQLADARLRRGQGAAAARAEVAEAEDRAPRLGKKAQAVEDARTAGEGSGWGDLLKPGLAH